MIGSLVIDLDGPLLSIRTRHYSCYAQILAERGLEPLPIRRYWALRRAAMPLSEILAATGADAIGSTFPSLWRERIEDVSFLGRDRLQPGVRHALATWHAQGHSIVVATMRQRADLAMEQLTSLGIGRFCLGLAVSDYRRGAIGKVEAVRSVTPGLQVKNTVWIGDTEVDIEAARYFGCPAWVVTCGIRDRSHLEAARPDVIAAGLAGLRLAG